MEGPQDGQDTARAVSVAEAAQLVGVSPQALRKRLARAGGPMRRVVGGRVVAVVELHELERLYPGRVERQVGAPVAPHQVAPPVAPVAAPAPASAADVSGAVAPLLREVERLQRELQEERVARARVEGELAASAKVETAAQRYADRAEERLAEAKREALSLARALGQVERERDNARAQLGAGRGWWARLTSRN